MEAPEHTIYRQRKWTRLWWIFGILAVVAILVVIIVPLAVILPRRHHSQGLISTVLVPLYIYPVSDAWEPLYEVLVLDCHMTTCASSLRADRSMQASLPPFSELHSRSESRQWPWIIAISGR